MGNTEKKLSYELLDLGFFSALGTSEHPGYHKEEVFVKRGTPNTHDSNNGVTVVCDEAGRPWIINNRDITDKIADDLRALLIVCDVKCGAYVPHSNDGGRFVLQVMAKL